MARVRVPRARSLSTVLALSLTAALAAACTSGHPQGSPPTTPSSHSPTPTPTLTATPRPADLGPVGVDPPSDFAPTTVSFPNPKTGFALGLSPCVAHSTQLCTGLVRTEDGGEHWVALTPPPLVLTNPYQHATVEFADDLDGVADDDTPGDALTVTHDGGLSWQMVALPGITDPQVADVAVGDGLFAVLAGSGHGVRYLYLSALGLTAFHRVADVAIDPTAGTISLVLRGGQGWVVASPATATATPQYFTGPLTGAWHTASLPCAAGDTAMVAASSALLVATICQDIPDGQTADKAVYLSSDGGQTWVQRGNPGHTGFIAGLTFPSPTNLDVAASSDVDTLYSSGNSAKSFALTFDSGGAKDGGGLGLYDLGFSSATTGAVVLGDTALWARALAKGDIAYPPPRMLTTTDGGEHWSLQLVKP